MKLAKIKFGIDLLEAILAAKNNDFVQTECPGDVKVVKVIQDPDDQANHYCVLVLTSEESDWPDVKMNGLDEIHFVGPVQYTVRDQDEDESLPPTQERAP